MKKTNWRDRVFKLGGCSRDLFNYLVCFRFRGDINNDSAFREKFNADLVISECKAVGGQTITQAFMSLVKVGFLVRLSKGVYRLDRKSLKDYPMYDYFKK